MEGGNLGALSGVKGTESGWAGESRAWNEEWGLGEALAKLRLMVGKSAVIDLSLRPSAAAINAVAYFLRLWSSASTLPGLGVSQFPFLVSRLPVCPRFARSSACFPCQACSAVTLSSGKELELPTPTSCNPWTLIQVAFPNISLLF